MQPLHQALQVDSEGQELAHWFVVAIPGHGDEMTCGTDINAAGTGVGELKAGAFDRLRTGCALNASADTVGGLTGWATSALL